MSVIIPQPDDMENDTVTIPVDEYLHMHDEIKFLRYLENNGVENWEGYDNAVLDWRVGG
jgi:hypothetical protein